MLLHMEAVALLFLFTDAFEDTILRFSMRTGFSKGWAMALYVCLDLLQVWVAVLAYAHNLLKTSVREIYLKKPMFSLRWCLTAVLLPVAINSFYLLFTDGAFCSGHLPYREQAAVFLMNIFVYGVKPAAICGMLFGGLALGAFDRVFRIAFREYLPKCVQQKMSILLSASLYAAISLVPELPALGSPGRGCLLLFSRILSGVAFASVTCACGSIWYSVMADALFRAFCGNGWILHIDTEQDFPAIFTYTLSNSHWTVAGLSGNFYLETALPAMAGFAVLALYAWNIAGKNQRKKSPQPQKKAPLRSFRIFHANNSRFPKGFADSLTGTMLKRLACGLAVGAYLLMLLYFGGRTMLRQYFAEHGTQESALADTFREYVRVHHIAATDAKTITIWQQKQKVQELLVARKGRLLYDASYPGELLHGSKQMPGSVWRPYYCIAFADGDADVYLSTGFDEAYYRLLFAGAAICGFGACLFIVVSQMLDTVSYIQCLRREVDAIRQGFLYQSVTVKGKDELGQLALGLDQMRRQLLETMEAEKQMRAAQEKLVLGMSHDLRTPLAGLFTYMDILKKRSRDNPPVLEYACKAYDKIQQIKHLSDQMFEYFFISSRKEAVLEPMEEISSAFGDYLSEMCALLDCCGFSVDCTLLVWKPVFVRVDTGYLGRIMDNLYSNLEKYADREKEVQLQILYERRRTGIFIKNSIAKPGQYVEGTGIGVKNISLMMEQMGGAVQVEMTQEDYCIALYFPLCEEKPVFIKRF